MNRSLETFVPLQFKRKKGKLLVDGRESAHDVRIIEAVARAMYWHDLLDTGTFKSVVEIARAKGLMPTLNHWSRASGFIWRNNLCAARRNVAAAGSPGANSKARASQS